MFTPDTIGYLPETPSQTAGPYVHIGLIPRQAGFEIFERDLGSSLLTDATKGERIRVEGRIFDMTGALVRDALVEVWQADAGGKYSSPKDHQEEKEADPAFRGWGRTGTDFRTGVWHFETIKPGPVPGRPGHRAMAPHLNLWIAARGLNIGLHTRLYFGDEEARNAEDPVLNIVEPAERRETLVARREDRDGTPCYVLDIRLSGPGETVFFDV